MSIYINIKPTVQCTYLFAENFTNNRVIPLFAVGEMHRTPNASPCLFEMMATLLIIFHNSLATITMASTTPNRRIMFYGI